MDLEVINMSLPIMFGITNIETTLRLLILNILHQYIADMDQRLNAFRFKKNPNTSKQNSVLLRY